MKPRIQDCQAEPASNSGQQLEVILVPDATVENMENDILQEYNQAFEALRDK